MFPNADLIGPIEPLTIRDCRGCGARSLYEVFSLGNLQLSNVFPHTDEERHAVPAVPHTLLQCAECGLVQMSHTTPARWLYSDYGYGYRSGTNETMKAELHNVVQTAGYWVPTLGDGDRVLDIGANDGTLLQAYSHQLGHVDKVAVEPLPGITKGAHLVVNALFPSPLALAAIGGRRFKVITAIAMFYDLDDPRGFLAACRDLLTPDGILILQFQDLGQMLAAGAWDNIVAEHLCHYTLHTVAQLAARHGLYVIDAEERAINGGSLRVVLGMSQPERSSDRARSLYALEVDRGLHRVPGAADPGPGALRWADFTARFRSGLAQTRTILDRVRVLGGTVHLYGASTKGNTWLQVAGVGSSMAAAAWERSPEKVGRQTMTGIPIISEETGREDPPTLLLSTIWQFKRAVIQREQAYLLGGGAILCALPTVEVVQVGR